MSAAKTKPTKIEKKTEKAAAKPAGKSVSKSDPKPDSLSFNGIPLRRKSVWAIDTDSPQFRAARKRDAQALSAGTDDRDSQQFLDAVLAEKDVQKWWK
jgi:hypothetical protein